MLVYKIYFKNDKDPDPKEYEDTRISIEAYGVEISDSNGIVIYPWHMIEFIEWRNNNG